LGKWTGGVQRGGGPTKGDSKKRDKTRCLTFKNLDVELQLRTNNMHLTLGEIGKREFGKVTGRN